MAIELNQLSLGHAYWDGDQLLVCTKRSLSHLDKNAIKVLLLVGWNSDGQSIYHTVGLSSLVCVEDDPQAPPHPRPRLSNFESLSDVFRHFRLTKKNYNKWRHCGPVQGWINGLQDSTTGTLWCTDGIMCIIELANDRYFEGHIHWFVPADDDEEIELSRKLAKIKHEDETKTTKRLDVKSYINLTLYV